MQEEKAGVYSGSLPLLGARTGISEYFHCVIGEFFLWRGKDRDRYDIIPLYEILRRI